MSSSRHRDSHSGEVPSRAKAQPGNPLRKLISALLPAQAEAPSAPAAPAPAPAPRPQQKTPPPVQVLQLPKGVGTELHRAVGLRKSAPPVKAAPPVAVDAAPDEAPAVGAAVPAARELKSVMRKLKAAPVPPPVKPAESAKAAHTTRYPSRRTRHRDFPVI